MAEAIGLAIFSAVGVEAAAVGTAVGISASAAASIAGSAVLLGGSFAVSALTTTDTRQKVQAQQFQSKQSMPARCRIYGTWMKSGPNVVFDTANGRAFTGPYICEGPINRFLEIWLDDTKANLPAQPDVSGPAGVLPWLAAVEIDARHGGVGPSQYASLLAPLSYWTPDHLLNGCAYVAMRATAPAENQFKKVYPSGTWPSVRALVEGAKVRNVNDPTHTADPNTWQWSDLASLCARDLITHPTWGMGVPDEMMDDVSWKEAANLDFERIYEKDGTEFPRYFIGGSYELTEDPADVLTAILQARDGELYLTPEGKIGITGGRYVAPDVTISQKHVISVASIERGSGKRASFNRLNISYVSRLHGFNQVEGEAWGDQDAIEEAGETLDADFSRPWAPRHNQLRRLAKIHMARQNPTWRITGLVCNRGAFAAVFESNVNLDLALYGITGPFHIERAVMSADQTTVTFDLASIDPTAWDFNAVLEQGNDPPVPGTNAVAPPANPVNLAVTVERRAVTASVNAAFLRLITQLPARDDVHLIGRYRKQGTSDDWLLMVADAEDRGSVISSVVEDGKTYEVEGAIATYGQALQSAWVPAVGSPISVQADPNPPDAPSGLFTTVQGSSVVLRWQNSASANVAAANVYRGSSLIGRANAAPNTQSTFTDNPPNGTYSYTVRDTNASGVESAPSNTASATVGA